MIDIIIPIGEGQRNYAKEDFERVDIDAIEIVSTLHPKGNDGGKCKNLETAKQFVTTDLVCLCDSDIIIPDDIQNILNRCKTFLGNRPEIDGVAVDTKGHNKIDLEHIDKQEKYRHVCCAFLVIRNSVYRRIDFTFTGTCVCTNFNRDAKICYLDYTTHLTEVKR